MLRISTTRIQTWLAAPFLLIALDAGCFRTPRLTEYDEDVNSQARSAPLVVISLPTTLDLDTRSDR
jgi:hypothetical protein